MELPPTTSDANVTKNPTCLEHEVFIRCFGPHGSGHRFTRVDTFPSTQITTWWVTNPKEILGGDPF